MKKKELKAELEYLKKVVKFQREDIRTLLSEGREFDKLMIKVRYDLEIDLQDMMWRDCTNNNSGLPNGFHDLIINTPIQDL
jgi:hypothetical protein